MKTSPFTAIASLSNRVPLQGVPYYAGRVRRAEHIGVAAERLTEWFVPWTMKPGALVFIMVMLVVLAIAPMFMGLGVHRGPIVLALAVVATRFLGRAILTSTIGEPRCARCGYARPNFDPPQRCPECGSAWREHGGTTCDERVVNRRDAVIGLGAVVSVVLVLTR